jgi:hypothetical protein
MDDYDDYAIMLWSSLGARKESNNRKRLQPCKKGREREGGGIGGD